VTFNHAGTCTVTASAGNDDYLAASDSQDVVVPQVSQPVNLTFSPALDGPATVGDNVKLTATGGDSGNPVDIEVGPTEVCSFVDDTISYLNAGECDVSATQAANDDYLGGSAATSVDVVAPTSTDLTVTGEVTGVTSNRTFFSVTAVGLLPNTSALVTVEPEGTYELQPADDGAACRKTGPASWSCVVTFDNPSVRFQANVQPNDHRTVDLGVSPIDPLIDTNPDDNSQELPLGE